MGTAILGKCHICNLNCMVQPINSSTSASLSLTLSLAPQSISWPWKLALSKATRQFEVGIEGKELELWVNQSISQSIHPSIPESSSETKRRKPGHQFHESEAESSSSSPSVGWRKIYSTILVPRIPDWNPSHAPQEDSGTHPLTPLKSQRKSRLSCHVLSCQLLSYCFAEAIDGAQLKRREATELQSVAGSFTIVKLRQAAAAAAVPADAHSLRFCLSDWCQFVNASTTVFISQPRPGIVLVSTHLCTSCTLMRVLIWTGHQVVYHAWSTAASRLRRDQRRWCNYYYSEDRGEDMNNYWKFK